MITHYLKGGLGNQLFQIFATIALSLRLGKTFVFDFSTTNTVGCTYRPTYWQTVFQYLVSFIPEIEWVATQTGIRLPATCKHIYHSPDEPGHHYQSIDHLVDSDSNDLETLYVLDGYYQSYKYFDKEEATICKMLQLEEMKEAVASKFPYVTKSNTISMHFRIGDYMKLLNCHPILQADYYVRSLQFILDKIDQIHSDGNDFINVYYFCQPSDYVYVRPTIDLLESTFPMCKFLWQIGAEDWEELLLMSLCNHNIIANSTFSLWGSYLNTHKDAIVCYPSVWFGYDMAHYRVDDMFRPHWNQIETTNIYRRENR
jgi:Glycosyl transferase family 11